MSHPHALLVVDDSEAEREIMAFTLAEAFPGADVSRTAYPNQARDLCGDHAFDCVLVDYNMPEMDGVELSRELRAKAAYLPIILVTSVGDEMLAAEALRSGITDYIPKPRITAESIRRTVNRSIQVCDQARLIDEQRAELENFAYALAHDFKQPIRQIITFTQLISEQIQEGEVGGTEQHLAFLRDAAGRLGRLVDVMSQYTLLNQAPALADIELDRVAASVKASLAPFLAERGGEIISPLPLPTVHGNETLMTQVLQNLIVNGLRYNRSRAPRIELTAHRRAEQWVISIRDNGIGIEAEFLTEIFRPLMRLHSAHEYPGTGLGLTLARKAVLAQKGAIWCESTPGEGSVFHLRLPTAAADRRKHVKKPSKH